MALGFSYLPNHNYARGRAREYQVMEKLRKVGWFCSRSAMSHGPVDVFAAKRGKVKLIQVKSGSARITNEELARLKAWGAAFKAEAQVWSFKKRGLIETKTVWKPPSNRKQTSQTVDLDKAQNIIVKKLEIEPGLPIQISPIPIPSQFS